MKRLDELTQAELVALTQEEINAYLRLACVEEGIPTNVPDPGPEPTPPPIADKDKVTVYECCGVLFWTSGDASVVLSSMASVPKVTFDYNSVYELKYIVPMNDYSVPQIHERSFLASKEVALAYETKYKEFRANHDSWKGRNKEYQKSQDRIGAMYLDIQERIREAHSALSYLDYLKKEWATCLQCAEGNVEIAEKFFNKMFSNITFTPEVQNEINSWIKDNGTSLITQEVEEVEVEEEK